MLRFTSSTLHLPGNGADALCCVVQTVDVSDPDNHTFLQYHKCESLLLLKYWPTTNRVFIACT